MKKTVRLSCILLALLLMSTCVVTVASAEPVGSAETVIYEENFEDYTAIESYTDLGWTEAFNGSRITAELGTDGENKCLKLTVCILYSGLKLWLNLGKALVYHIAKLGRAA